MDIEEGEKVSEGEDSVVKLQYLSTFLSAYSILFYFANLSIYQYNT